MKKLIRKCGFTTIYVSLILILLLLDAIFKTNLLFWAIGIFCVAMFIIPIGAEISEALEHRRMKKAREEGKPYHHPYMLPMNETNKYEFVRREFRPKKVKLLLVGESPPVSGKFFYLGSVMTQHTATAFTKAYGVQFGSQEEFLTYFIKKHEPK